MGFLNLANDGHFNHYINCCWVHYNFPHYCTKTRYKFKCTAMNKSNSSQWNSKSSHFQLPHKRVLFSMQVYGTETSNDGMEEVKYLHRHCIDEPQSSACVHTYVPQVFFEHAHRSHEHTTRILSRKLIESRKSCYVWAQGSQLLWLPW